jgi:type IV secretory pathway VirB10-like protein
MARYQGKSSSGSGTATDIRASPCTSSAEVMRAGRARFQDRDYPLDRLAQAGEKVETMMRQIALVCAALSLGIFVSPASAQQAPPEQASPPSQQTGPNEPASPTDQSMPEEAQPPSTPQAEPLPPPFPPMPRARPSHRWVDLGEKHKSRAHRHSARTHRRHANKERRAAQPSSRMARRCLKMSLRQAMRQSACRSLMRNNLHASAPRHHHSARHHSARRRNSAQHRHRHQARRRRR